MKKTAKKAAKKSATRRPVRRETPIPETTIATAESAPVAVPVTPVTTTKPRPLARTHRRLASPAQRRGADLVRYLRIHAKRPYGERGVRALIALAREVGHLANAELNAVAQH